MVTEVMEFPAAPQPPAAAGADADGVVVVGPDAGLVHHLAVALRTAAALVDADAGAAFAHVGDRALYLAASAGLSAAEVAALRDRLAAGDPAAGDPGAGDPAADRGAAILADAASGDAAPRPFADPLPVRAPDGRTWGSIVLCTRGGRPPGDDRLVACEAFLEEMGWALARDRRAAELERAQAAAAASAAQAARDATPTDGAARPSSVASPRWDREVAVGVPPRVLRGAARQPDAAADHATLMLRRVASALLRAGDAAAVRRAIAEQAVPVVGARAAVVLAHHPDAAVLRVAAAAGDPAALPAIATELPDAGSHPAALALRERHPRFVEAPTPTTRRGGRPARPRRRPAADAAGGAIAALPLHVGDGVPAVLLLELGPGVPLDPARRAMLVALAGMGGQALERVHLTAAARAASEAKSDFLAMMSHELRTPLNAIMGYTGLIADEVVGPVNDTQRAQLRRVQDQARHLLELVEEVLTLSRAESGAERLRLEPVDPAALLRDVVQVLAPSASRQGLAIETRVAADVPDTVGVDADKVRQVLAHLLTNAVKFTEEGGIVAAVHAEDDGATLVFAVSDTGVGIAPDDMRRIFEPFWQAERTHARRLAGTGLGLNVTRRLADVLGGEIRVESAPGRGSTFALAVPVATMVADADA